ncbi:MAG: L-aspartate oxidase [Chloroflexi bacterium]|nr:L-aspartate oxidase [Chloroflexota bacterium]
MSLANDLIQTDALILGSGIAGCTAALRLADGGMPVTVVTRTKEPRESNTYYAQGGIIYRSKEDSPEALAEDIIRAGAGHCNPRAVQILAREGPRALEEMLLKRAPVAFDSNEKGELDLAREGGHSVSRIAHVADATGKAIETALIRAVSEHPNIQLLTNHTAVDILTPSHHSLNRLAVYDRRSCVGAYVLDRETGRVKRCLAKETILATGGLGEIFLHTSNPPGARGDGVAMAYRAGARVINMEFIQFHPTTFQQSNAPNFLISEAVRGAGARLVTPDGEPFMQKYAPEWKDLAPRDVVARGIHQEMLTRGLDNVYLDLRSYIPKEVILEHFPTIYRQCLAYGVDITRDLIPVAPAAHYSCGGIWVDEWGRSTIEHLYAIGEVSCTGLHGANRLASTSLLEGLVWGMRAAQYILENPLKRPTINPDDIPPWQDEGLEAPDPALILQDMNAVRSIMWNYVGLVRTTRRLARALRALPHLESEIERFYRRSKLTDALVGLRSAVRVGIIVSRAAWSNKRSMGAHYRE